MDMPRPENGVYIIQGEVNLLITATRRSTRYAAQHQQNDEHDPLLSSFIKLRDTLIGVTDLHDMKPNEFLGPFLDVIRSEDTSGPVTGLALTSINKFISYGLLDTTCETSAQSIENIADAVTHARFVGTDPSSDEVVLMKILQVLRTLILSPAGFKLTNESVCEIMQSCFRICFEMRLSELLRKSAEHTLVDMVQLLFGRLPQFKEDAKFISSLKKMKMRSNMLDSRTPRKKRGFRKKKDQVMGYSPSTTPPPTSNVSQDPEQPNSQVEYATKTNAKEDVSLPSDSVEETSQTPSSDKPTVAASCDSSTNQTPAKEDMDSTVESEIEAELSKTEVIATTPVNVSLRVVDIHEGFQRAAEEDAPAENSNLAVSENVLQPCSSEGDLSVDLDKSSTHSGDDAEHSEGTGQEPEYVNPKGVRFTMQQQAKNGSGPLIPYGLPCVRELFRFLISLTNPVDRHNTDVMIHMGVSLLTIALETGADHIPAFSSVLGLVKDDMLKSMFLLLQSDRLSLFAASMRVCFLVFESLRSHVKFQLEMYITRLMDLIVTDSPKVSYEQREMALEALVQILHIPGLVAELYINYDCDLHCSNLFEDLMKLLSKNAFPVSGLYTTHLLSLDALLAVIEGIENNCHHRLRANPPPDSKPEETNEDFENKNLGEGKKMSKVRRNRMKATSEVLPEEAISSIKNKKKLYQQGIELFNNKPSKGIGFLQEQGLLDTPLDPGQVATFLRENHKLDKKMIGEYISNKKNKSILEAYQRSFHFKDVRVDEALRMYLETFRLPGEAPVISFLMEHFADYWHAANGEPFANADAAFTLGYAIIMLNVDQHNLNAKKQNIPMTSEAFKKNLKNVNGGADFDQDMLQEVYDAIKNDEIVMPAEQTGLVRENYLWKVLLRRGNSREGHFEHLETGSYDRDLFSLVWGPTVAALSFVFDKSLDDNIVNKAVKGFKRCAMIAAYYGLSDVFDNLVISLCKFTTLLSAPESAESIPIQLGSNPKAKLAAKTVFALARTHGDILREGWKNIVDCLLQLNRAKLLPDVLVKVEDFVDPSGRISLIREESQNTQKSESGVFSSFYSYFSMAESNQQYLRSMEEQEAIKKAQSCIQECHIDQLITDSKFLRADSLQEFLKALVFASRYPEMQETMSGTHCEEEVAVFSLELLITVILQNRDRIGPFWQSIRDHLYSLIVNANEYSFLMERAVVGLLRLAVRLLRRDQVAPQVLASLQMLLLMKPTVIHSVCRQISYGMHDLLRTNAANIHNSRDWCTLFTLMEVVGAGTDPPPLMQVDQGVNVPQSISDAGAQSDSELHGGMNDVASDRGYTSDSEIYTENNMKSRTPPPSYADIKAVPSAGSWLLVNREDVEAQKKSAVSNQFSLDIDEELKFHDTRSLVKSCETLAFLVRDAAHITPHNFESCVHTIRTFVEACLNGGQSAHHHHHHKHRVEKKHHRRNKKDTNMHKSRSSPSHLSKGVDEDIAEREPDSYHSISIQLLDLMHTLHTKAAKIVGSWEDEHESVQSAGEMTTEGSHQQDAYIMGLQPKEATKTTLWLKCWCPLLQGIARLCCDSRRQVRSQALTYLQRALLVHDLQTLSAEEWESCFSKVLFPLLSKLLTPINSMDPTGMEETRMRASTLLCKVFLQHLTPLLSLATFTALWLTILDFMDKYMHADSSDLLCEAIPESLKNMLLVMNTAGILSSNSSTEESQLWSLTWHRIDAFLPTLRSDVFKPQEVEQRARPSTPVDETVSRTAEPPRIGNTDSTPETRASPGSRSASPVHGQIGGEETPHRGGYILHPPLPQVPTPDHSPARDPRQSPTVPTHGTTPTHGSPATKVTPLKKDTVEGHSIPLLLNPDIIQGNTFPIISPQSDT